jgi:hydrogenase maturation protein HypF
VAVAVRSPAEEVVASEVALPRPVATVLAVGAFLKNTLCLTRGARALVSRDVGNLDTVDAVREFDDTAERLLDLAGAPLAAVAHDLHPDFHSTRYAEALAARLGIGAVAVQHHHAHVAAVMAEHGIEQPVLGLALDGFGLGAGNQSWGGELLEVGPAGYWRLGHLAPLLQPGGDRAAREPWRMGAAALHALGRGDEIAVRYQHIAGAPVIARMLERGVNAPPTSSCGRLFDAACGLLGVKPIAAFEGEAPMELERLAVRLRIDPHGWRLAGGVLDMRPLLDRLTDIEAEEGAGLFHGTLIAAMTAWAAWAAEETGLRRVVLSGGCFFNKVLTTGLVEGLGRLGITCLTARRLTPGDPAISLGQAWVVAMAAGMAKG